MRVSYFAFAERNSAKPMKTCAKAKENYIRLKARQREKLGCIHWFKRLKKSDVEVTSILLQLFFEAATTPSFFWRWRWLCEYKRSCQN